MICAMREGLRDFTTHWADFSRKECDKRIFGRKIFGWIDLGHESHHETNHFMEDLPSLRAFCVFESFA